MVIRALPPALPVLIMVSLGLLTLGELHSAHTSATGQVRHPEWLLARDIETLLSENTLTSLNSSSSVRWWSFYLEDGTVSWINDQGKTGFGFWHISQDLLCEVWKPGEEKCWGIRFTGKVVRFDDPFTGQPYSASVLQMGDTKDLRAKVTPEVRESLQKLREPGPPLVALESDTGAVAGLEMETSEAIGEGPGQPLKMRIVHPDSAIANQLIEELSGVQLAAANERADLIWDVVRGEVARDQEIIAYPRTDEPGEVQLVVDASLLIDHMKEMATDRANGLLLQMTPEQDSYGAGETITLVLANMDGMHALLFNVGPFGDIDILYPVQTDFVGDGWPQISSTRPLSMSTVAGSPFGENLVVGVVSADEPRVLLKTLQFGGGPAGISAFLKALRETEGQLAVLSFKIHR